MDPNSTDDAETELGTILANCTRNLKDCRFVEPHTEASLS